MNLILMFYQMAKILNLWTFNIHKRTLLNNSVVII